MFAAAPSVGVAAFSVFFSSKKVLGFESGNLRLHHTNIIIDPCTNSDYSGFLANYEFLIEIILLQNNKKKREKFSRRLLACFLSCFA